MLCCVATFDKSRKGLLRAMGGTGGSVLPDSPVHNRHDQRLAAEAMTVKRDDKGNLNAK